MDAPCWHRTVGDLLKVRMVSWWRDLAAIRGYTGENITAAKYYPFDAQFLLEMAQHVTDFDCFGRPSLPVADPDRENHDSRSAHAAWEPDSPKRLRYSVGLMPTFLRK